MHRNWTFGLVLLTSVATFGSAIAQDKKPVTMVAYGGSWQDAKRKALWEPIFAKLGIPFKEDSLKGIAEVRLQVQSGRPVWDIVGTGIGECVAAEKEGLWEPVDYSIVTNAKDLPPSLRGKSWIGGTIWSSFVITWNKKKYGDNHPKNWADYFDVKKFPGTRAAYNAPRFMLEAALMADGVPKEKVYPIDFDRAFKKLRELKKSGAVTVWYDQFGAATQLMKDEEVDIVPVFDGRAIEVIEDGAPWGFTFNQGVTNSGCEAIVKGAPNKEAAMRVLNELLDPVIESNLPKYVKYGPVNPKAYETGLIPPDVMRALNSSPENMKLQLELDANWWGDNHREAQLRWDQFMKE